MQGGWDLTPRPVRFGVDEAHAPRFTVEEGGCEPLGEWSDGTGVAFAQTMHGGCRSVYAGAAPLPAPILRQLAREAGVRLWSSTTDIVRATSDDAMIVATSAGKRTFTLPRPVTPHGGGSSALRHEVDAQPGDVTLFTV